MKKKIMAILTSAMCLAAATLNSVNVVSAADEETDVPVLMGDVNADGSFNVADVVLLQKWILAVPNTDLANWKAADFYDDQILNVFDLCLMKRALIEKLDGTPELEDPEVREILFGYADAASGQSKPMSEIRIAMKCKAFCPAGETLNVDVARLGFSDSQIYEGNSFLYKYFIRSGENWQKLNAERLIVNGKAGGYEKYYYDDDRQMFLVGREYDDYSAYHHETAELDFQNYTAGSSGCIAFNFCAQFYDDNGELPEQPQSEGCGQLLYYYVGEDGVGISNANVEDAEKAYQSKGTNEVAPINQYTGRWHGKDISYNLYEALIAENIDTIPVSVTLSGLGIDDYIYKGRTIHEYNIDLVSNDDIAKLEQLLEQGDMIKYGEVLYTTGTPDGTGWTKSYYDQRVKFYGEELLSRYIVDGEFLKEQLQSDLKELKAPYQAALDEAVDAFYQERIDEMIGILETNGIRSERIEDTHDIVMYITAAEFETLSLENASYFSIAFEEPAIL